MLRRKVTRGATLAFVFIVTAWQIDCAEEVHFVAHRFELESCPLPDFSLPASMENPQYRLEAVGRGWFAFGEPTPICSGFEIYQLDERTEAGALVRRGAALQARLNRGASCSLDVTYSYITGMRPAVREIQPEELTQAAEILAQLVVSGATAPRLPAARTELFGSDAELKQWCELSVGRDHERDSPFALAHAFREAPVSVCQ